MKRAPFVAAALLLFAGCTSDPPQPPEHRPEPEARTIPAADVPSPPEPAGSAGPVVAGGEQAKLRQLLEGMAAAAEEASETGEGTMCEQAYESTVRFARALRENLGAPAPPSGEPSRERFLAACGRLPEDVQRCMVMQYSMTHREECAQLREGMTPEVRESVHELTTMLGLQQRLAPGAAPAAPGEPAAP